MVGIDVTPQVLDLTLYAGDGVAFRLSITDKEGIPVPITGSMEAEIRTRRTDPDPPKAHFTIDLTDGEDGIALLSLTGDQTQQLAPDRQFTGVWDLQWTPSAKQPRTLCQGKVVCVNDVSR